MNKPLKDYYQSVQQELQTGQAREHSYRPALKVLLEGIVPEIVAQNEPARIACGAPDYILTKGNIPVGFIEAKDVDVSLDKTEKSAQLKRYLESLENLILTDYHEFRLFRNGERVSSISIMSLERGKLKPLQENWPAFENLLKDFCGYRGQTIKSSSRLAQMMAGKAKLMYDVIHKALTVGLEDQETKQNEENLTLQGQLEAFRDILIHDIDEAGFADIYAQTIAYGMFAARLHDQTLEDFSRQEAASLIPKTNPFLRKLFQYIAGYDLDDRLVWVVDSLAEVFRACDVRALLEDFGSTTQQNDPFIHFYESFLAEYNPKLRKTRGVYYTPEPVVDFLVQAVDQLLKRDFGLSEGLADSSKTQITVDTEDPDKHSPSGYREEEREFHRVQILDPATGTGTFLSEVVKYIYNSRFQGQQGIWSGYVEKHLIPRLNGFEILMASYAMCHLKLDLLLAETGYKSSSANPQRFNVFLTNALEEGGRCRRMCSRNG